ncbi:unnamed protein product, partial [Polarella glacialis]
DGSIPPLPEDTPPTTAAPSRGSRGNAAPASGRTASRDASRFMSTISSAMPAWMMSGQALMSGEADAPLPPPVPSRGEPGYSRYSRPEAPSRPDPEYPPPPTQSPAPSRPDPEYPPPPTQSPLILEDPFDHTDFEMQPDVVQERTQPRMPGADMRASPNLPPASASIATRTAVSAAQFFDAAQRE